MNKNDQLYVTDSGLQLLGKIRTRTGGTSAVLMDWILNFVAQEESVPFGDVLSYFAEYYDSSYSTIRLYANELVADGYLAVEEN